MFLGHLLLPALFASIIHFITTNEGDMNQLRRVCLMGLATTLFSLVAFAQSPLPFYDGFDYADGSMLGGQGSWVDLNTGDTIVVTAGSLTYPGLAASTGNRVKFDAGGKDPAVRFDSTATGIVYYSFLMKVTNVGALSATGGYFAAFYNTSTGTTTGAPVWTRLNGTSFDIGVSLRISTPVTWSDGKTLDNTYFIVGAYRFVDGANNDSAYLWINPDASTFGQTPPAATIAAVNVAGTTDLASVVRFFLRQDATDKTPFLEVDEVRLGLTWASVTPASGSSHVAERVAGAIPDRLQLAQNFPNPFNPSTTIEFAVASTQLVTVKVHDMLGREVATLVDHTLNPGLYRTKWNAMDNPSGLYFYTVRAGNETLTRRMALVK